MMKFLMVMACFVFQVMLPMELMQVHQSTSLPEVNLALLRLDQINTWCKARSEECQHKIQQSLSPDMSLIHDIAMVPEDVKKHIIF